jgi:hypothetical protein
MAHGQQPFSAPLLNQLMESTVDDILLGFQSGQLAGFIKQVRIKDNVCSGKHDTPLFVIIIHMMQDVLCGCK